MKITKRERIYELELEQTKCEFAQNGHTEIASYTYEIGDYIVYRDVEEYVVENYFERDVQSYYEELEIVSNISYAPKIKCCARQSLSDEFVFEVEFPTLLDTYTTEEFEEIIATYQDALEVIKILQHEF